MFKPRREKINGFTLIEVMIVIAILGVLAAMITGNFLTSLKKGRDARRKGDLGQIQQALEMFYEDKKVYPTPPFPFGGKFCQTAACASGEKIYMQKVPSDPRGQNNYLYTSQGTYYRLYSCLENEFDQGEGVNQLGYSGTDCGPCQSNNLCKYAISSSNVSP